MAQEKQWNAYFNAQRAAETARHANKNTANSMKTKLEVLTTMVEAKRLVRDHLYGNIDASDFARQLAEDENVRKTVNLLCQQVLQPTPIAAPPDRSNKFVNFGAGFSTFWNKMQEKLPIEIENVSEIENVLMNINAGLDKNMEPDTRKMFLREAGMTQDMAKEFVPLSDYADYEARAKESVRAQVMKDLGLEPGQELTENEQLAVDSMTEDRIMGLKMQITYDNYEPTFEDIYGISIEDMYEMFGDSMEGTVADNEPVAGTAGVFTEYWELLGDTIENNLAMIEQLSAGLERTDGLSFTEDDLAFAEGSVIEETDVEEQFSDGFPSITDADLAFAEQYAAYEDSME